MRPALVFQRKTGDATEAEDLAQDVLVRALGHADWKSTEEAKGYIFRAAINRWRDHLRRRRSHGIPVTLDSVSEIDCGVEPSPERVLIARDELHQIARVLDGLNVRTRAVLMLVKFEQMGRLVDLQQESLAVAVVSRPRARELLSAEWVKGMRYAHKVRRNAGSVCSVS